MYLDTRHESQPVTPAKEPSVSARDREILLRAADLIRQRGLAKHVLEDKQRRLCVYGAIDVAIGGKIAWPRLEAPVNQIPYHLMDQYARRHWYAHAAAWNNAPQRTQEEVIAALEEVAAT